MRANVLETLLAAAATEVGTKHSIVSEHATSLVRTLLKNVLPGDMLSVVSFALTTNRRNFLIRMAISMFDWRRCNILEHSRP